MNEKKILIDKMRSFLDEKDSFSLMKKSLEIKNCRLGGDIFVRVLLEISNRCQLNCNYCGIRFKNSDLHRYQISESEIDSLIDKAYQWGYRSFVLQSGENHSSQFIFYINNLITAIKKRDQKINITLSLGVYPLEIYQKWRDLGANRYLLRIETSNNEIFNQLHSDGQSLEKRIEALKNLRKANFQVGTGVMIGLPNQTEEDLVNDLLFIKNLDVDMVGMGPYIEHEQTPLGQAILEKKIAVAPLIDRFWMSIKMISLLRQIMPTINIASSTALETIRPDGRKLGIMAGANVIMPNITPIDYRKDYHLYQGKPLSSDNPMVLKENLKEMLESIGQKINISEAGHSLHFLERIKNG